MYNLFFVFCKTPMHHFLKNACESAKLYFTHALKKARSTDNTLFHQKNPSLDLKW